MPEYPEVHLTVKHLRRLLRSRIIGVQPQKFEDIIGADVEVGHCGKVLYLHFRDKYIIIHAMLNGKWSYKKPSHPKLTLSLEDGNELYYSEPRNFGYVKLVDSLDSISHAPDAYKVSAAEFDNALDTRSSVYTALINQDRLAGIGNYIACEALYDAGIHPKTRASDLSDSEIQKLHVSIKKIIRESIAAGGSCHYKVFDKVGEYEPRIYKKSHKTLNISGRTVYY